MIESRKPPHSARVLQRWVGELAREQEVAAAPVQRWISFMVVAALLEQADAFAIMMLPREST